MPLLTPKAEAQRQELVLTVSPGLNGGRIAFVGGSRDDVIADFQSQDEAARARKAAMQAVADLNRIFNTTKGAA